MSHPLRPVEEAAKVAPHGTASRDTEPHGTASHDTEPREAASRETEPRDTESAESFGARQHRRLGYLAWVTVCLVWGTTYLAIRVALETVPPFVMTGLRWTAAGALILVAVAISGTRLPPLRSWWASALPGILLIGFGNGFVVWAEQTVPSGLTAVLVAAIPFWQVGVERLMPNADPVGWRRIIGLVVGFSGIVLLVWPDLRLGESRGFAAGVVSTQLACLGWALGSSLSRRHRREGSVVVTSAIQMLMGGLLMSALATFRGEWQGLGFTARTGGALAYLVVVGSIVGFSAYGYALRHLPIALVSLYAYVNPVIAVLLGTLLLSEPLSPRLALASAVVLLGMAMVRERAQ